MKKFAFGLMLVLAPISAYADKYEDMQSGIREILIAFQQLDVKAAQAQTVHGISQALLTISKDLGDLQKEYKATQDEVMACKDGEKSE